jgi:hypothetical protein
MGWHKGGDGVVSDWNLDALTVVVVVAVCSDFVTTTMIFTNPALSEGNEFLVAVADVHVSLALAFNLGYGVLLASTYVLVGGWMGRVAAAMAFPSAFLGVNNALYVAYGGPTLLDVLFGSSLPWVLSYGIPLFGFVLGTAWHVAREGGVPWMEVAGTTTAAGVAFGVTAALV